jgi:plastocyanin
MTVSVQLLATTTVEVSIAPNGYSGTVALAAGTLPSGVTAAFDKPTLTLDGETTATATLTVTTATSAPPGTVPLAVNATAGGMTQSTAVSVTVESTITLHIPSGVNNDGATVSNPNTTAYGPYPITIVAPAGISASNPVTVYFQNDDSVSHEIHADDQAQGFGHDPGSFGAGKMDPYVRKVNAAGTYDFYLHDQGSPITPGRVFIQASQ